MRHPQYKSDACFWFVWFHNIQLLSNWLLKFDKSFDLNILPLCFYTLCGGSFFFLSRLLTNSNKRWIWKRDWCFVVKKIEDLKWRQENLEDGNETRSVFYKIFTTLEKSVYEVKQKGAQERDGGIGKAKQNQTKSDAKRIGGKKNDLCLCLCLCFKVLFRLFFFQITFLFCISSSKKKGKWLNSHQSAEWKMMIQADKYPMRVQNYEFSSPNVVILDLLIYFATKNLQTIYTSTEPYIQRRKFTFEILPPFFVRKAELY